MAHPAEPLIDLDWHALSDHEIRQFDDRGFLIVRDVLDQQSIDRIIEVSDALVAGDRRENRYSNQDGLYDGFRNCVAMDDVFIPLLTHPKALSVVVQLLGAHVHLMISHLIYKFPDPPGTSATSRNPGWHRDYGAARKVLGDRVPRILLKCAFCLTDLDEPNSGVTLLAPGSNHDTKPIEIPDGKVDPPGHVEPSLKRGDCLLFENRIAHAAGANLTDRVRKAVMFGYGYRWVMPLDYRTQQPGLVEKLDGLGRYLVGERYRETKEYRPGGGDSPLSTWCEHHGAPAVRKV